jgi:hypothetical protein
MNLLNLLKKLFNTTTALELYIESKQPTNTADIENATKDYFTKSANGYFYN